MVLPDRGRQGQRPARGPEETRPGARVGSWRSATRENDRAMLHLGRILAWPSPTRCRAARGGRLGRPRRPGGRGSSELIDRLVAGDLPARGRSAAIDQHARARLIRRIGGRARQLQDVSRPVGSARPRAISNRSSGHRWLEDQAKAEADGPSANGSRPTTRPRAPPESRGPTMQNQASSPTTGPSRQAIAAPVRLMFRSAESRGSGTARRSTSPARSGPRRRRIEGRCDDRRRGELRALAFVARHRTRGVAYLIGEGLAADHGAASGGSGRPIDSMTRGGRPPLNRNPRSPMPDAAPMQREAARLPASMRHDRSRPA